MQEPLITIEFNQDIQTDPQDKGEDTEGIRDLIYGHGNSPVPKKSNTS